ncbi:MAG TPA: type III-B CRISPR-associated protein Cas10/Cmr2, partial [bacterium]|nr:type III-B CRISPR-associated protein Cas10/Cmr2 [bacterium]
MTNAKHLIIFSISPVQSFISQARKTGDLFAGSRILSEVSKAAVKSIKENSNKVIFPQESESLPNRIVAIVENDPEKVCKDAEKQAEAEFKEQIKTDTNFLRINYVAVPLSDCKDAYKEAYTKAEKYLGAVKNAGEFEKFVEEGGKKCSLCGERNVVIYRKTENDEKNERDKGESWLYKKKLFLPKEEVSVFSSDDEQKIKLKDLRKGECLCAVCAGKRSYSQNESFPSTVYFSLLSKINPEEIKQKETELEDIQKIYETKEGRSLPKYYALLHFDGDSMGKWLSGENLVEGKDLQEFHTKLSLQLSA